MEQAQQAVKTGTSLSTASTDHLIKTKPGQYQTPHDGSQLLQSAQDVDVPSHSPASIIMPTTSSDRHEIESYNQTPLLIHTQVAHEVQPTRSVTVHVESHPQGESSDEPNAQPSPPQRPQPGKSRSSFTARLKDFGKEIQHVMPTTGKDHGRHWGWPRSKTSPGNIPLSPEQHAPAKSDQATQTQAASKPNPPPNAEAQPKHEALNSVATIALGVAGDKLKEVLEDRLNSQPASTTSAIAPTNADGSSTLQADVGSSTMQTVTIPASAKQPEPPVEGPVPSGALESTASDPLASSQNAGPLLQGSDVTSQPSPSVDLQVYMTAPPDGDDEFVLDGSISPELPVDEGDEFEFLGEGSGGGFGDGDGGPFGWLSS